MTWARFDDEYDDNPKCRAAGKDGRALDQAAIRYCAKYLTDGLIPDHDLPVLAAKADVRQRPTVRRLVDAGRWHSPGHHCDRCPQCPPAHHVVHDYLDFNPTGEKERAKRQARAEAGRKGGLRSRPTGSNEEAKPEANASANGQAIEEQNRNPVPRNPPGSLSDNSRRLGGTPDDEDPDQQAPDPLGQHADQHEHAPPLDQLIGTTLAILVERDLDARQQNPQLTRIGDTEAWRRTATRKRTERGTPEALAELARAHPTADAQALADLLEPPAPATNGARPDPLAGQRQAMLDQANGGLDHMQAIIHEPPADPDVVARSLAAARHAAEHPGTPA